MSKKSYRTILCILVLAAIPLPLGAQLGTQGAIVGVVTAASDAVVSGANVTVLNVDTGLKLSVVTNDAGIFEVLALPVGSYSVTVTQRGFRPVPHLPVRIAKKLLDSTLALTDSPRRASAWLCAGSAWLRAISKRSTHCAVKRCAFNLLAARIDDEWRPSANMFAE